MTTTKYLEKHSPAVPALSDIVESGVVFHYRKIIHKCLNDTIRGLILESRASSDKQYMDAARSSLAADWVNKALSLIQR
ncbi:hypothetical protein VP01_456g4 [Puccinia sorghi]|uniref:Uncharacterized protein n=1 Tax=Puccinia sorghi TaxID=27349 RepID=A0A0L6UNP4_9BASI|nr:hypothetical protein VP01_456g4 [Puccinia sorghi]